MNITFRPKPSGDGSLNKPANPAQSRVLGLMLNRNSMADWVGAARSRDVRELIHSLASVIALALTQQPGVVKFLKK